MGELVPQGIINLLFRGGYRALPEAGNRPHVLRRDAGHALRLAQAAPFLQAGLDDRLIHRAHLRVQRRAGNKQLHQLGLGDQAQAQRKRLVKRFRGFPGEADGHVGQGMSRIDMRKIVKGALAWRHVQASIAAAAQRQQQVRFRALRMAVKPDAALAGHGAFNGLLARLRRVDAGKQGVGIVIQHGGVQARLVDPPD